MMASPLAALFTVQSTNSATREVVGRFESTPHGGAGLSGWGRTHSRVGLLQMVQVKYMDVDWLPRQPRTWWFGYDRALGQTAERFIDFSHALMWSKRWRGAAGAIKALFRGHRM
jgi:hypothetical protein